MQSRNRGWRRWVPGLRVLSEYRLEWLRGDVVAGVVLTAMLVPVGIAYGAASGVPGIQGLYATIFPLLGYAIFGPSRLIVMAPDSALSPVILAVVLRLAMGDPAHAVVVASGMAVVAGVVCILLGLLKLGFVTELLSKPIRYGYMNGIALTVLIAQLPKLLGFTIEAHGPLRGDLLQVLHSVFQGRTNWAAFAIGASVLVVIQGLKRYERIPGTLIAVVGAATVVAVLHLDEVGVQVLGALPQGLPSFRLPWVSGAELRDVIVGGCAVAMVAFADTSIFSRAYAARTRTPVDPNQEVIGVGASNLAAGLFQGFPISSSSTRTPVAEASGGKTQLTCVVCALCIALLLLVAPNLLSTMPQSALAGVVIAAAIGLFEIGDLGRIWRIQRWEFWLSIVCFVGVAVFGVIPGIAIAIGISILEFLWDGWRPHFAVLGKPEGIRGYHDVRRYPEARLVPGLVIFRWDAPLFFANAEQFHQRVIEAVAQGPKPVRRVVVSAEPVTSVDVTSADMLQELEQELRASGVELHFAELKDPVKDKLRRFELFDRFGAGRFHPTLHAAVDAYVKDSGVSWQH